MTAPVSLWTKLQRLSGLLGTRDLTGWEQRFVQSCLDKVIERDTRRLSDKEAEKIDEIWTDHFAS